VLKNNSRICDVCGGEIPKGTTSRVAKIRPEAAAIFLETNDPDMVPTWMQNPDGTVRIDVCLECHMNMGEALNTEEAN
jgi:hypothetical protein